MMKKSLVVLVVILLGLILTPLSLPTSQSWELGEGVVLQPSGQTNTNYTVGQDMDIELFEVQEDRLVINGEGFKGYGENKMDISVMRWDSQRIFEATTTGEAIFRFYNLESNHTYYITIDENKIEPVNTNEDGNFSYIHSEWSTHTFNIQSAEDMVEVETLEVEDIHLKSVVLKGRINKLDVDESEVYFKYRRKNRTEWEISDNKTITSEEEFAIKVEVEDDALYEYKAIAEWDYEGNSYQTKGDILEFEIPEFYATQVNNTILIVISAIGIGIVIAVASMIIKSFNNAIKENSD